MVGTDNSAGLSTIREDRRTTRAAGLPFRRFPGNAKGRHVVEAVTDTTTSAVAFALRGLATRAEVRADNVANLNTPGFLAKRVDFESTLAGALDRGGVPDAGPEIAPAMSLPNPRTQNNVNLEDEIVGMTKDNLLTSAMVNAFNFKINIMRSAIGSR
jgi:flagellar basal-body rod protein FlgB